MLRIPELGLMRTLVSLFSALSLSCGVVAAEPPRRMDLESVVDSGNRLVRHRVITRGCLVLHAHGAFVEPCGNEDWRRILLLDAPLEVFPSEMIMCQSCSGVVEADILGTLVLEKNIRGTGRHLVPRVEALSQVVVHLSEVPDGAPINSAPR
jgi:hypothetical protein